MICQAPDCTARISAEVLAVQPNTKTCRRPECRLAYRRMVNARNFRAHYRRKTQKQ